MRLVEEEHEPGLFRVAHLGQRLEQLGEQPEQVGRVKLGAAHQLVRGENADETAPSGIDAEEVVHLQRRLPEELVRPLALEGQQRALDRADGGLGDAAIFARDFVRMIRRPREQAAQILEIE